MNIGYNNEVISCVLNISFFRKPVLEIDNKYQISVLVVQCGIGTVLICTMSLTIW